MVFCKARLSTFNYHRASKTYIFADERTLAGKTSTTIQGFNEDGSKRFETVVGPDISNLAVNNRALSYM